MINEVGIKVNTKKTVPVISAGLLENSYIKFIPGEKNDIISGVGSIRSGNGCSLFGSVTRLRMGILFDQYPDVQLSKT